MLHAHRLANRKLEAKAEERRHRHNNVKSEGLALKAFLPLYYLVVGRNYIQDVRNASPFGVMKQDPYSNAFIVKAVGYCGSTKAVNFVDLKVCKEQKSE